MANKVGRPKKVKTEETKIIQQENTIPSPTPVSTSPYSLEATSERWSRVFANSQSSGFDYFLAMQNALANNPYVQSTRLKMLKSQPNLADRETLENAILNPGYNELTIRQEGWGLASSNYPLYKMMKLESDILLYRTYAFPKYVSKSDMETPRFTSDSKIVDMWLKKLKPEYTFKRITLEVAREGKKSYYYRQKINSSTGNESVSYAELQDLPSDWVKITSKSNNSYFKVSFNFAYFWTPGTTVDQFDPIFMDYYKELMNCTVKNSNGFEINISKAPDNALVEYTGGNWYFWKELDSDKAFTFSSDESHTWQVPSLMPLFVNASDLQSYSFLQQQLLSVPLYGLLTAEIPFHDGTNKSGNFTNDLRLSDGMVEGFSNIYNAMAPAGNSIFAAPFNNMKMEHFPEIPNASKIYEQALKGLTASAGLNGLLSVNEKPSVPQVLTSQKIEASSASGIYSQFKNFMNICLENHLGLKFAWESRIFGNIFSEDNDLLHLEKGLSMGMTSLLPDYLAMYGMTVEDSRSKADWVLNTGLYDQMRAIVSGFNSNSSDGKNGRPPENNPQNDSTATSQESGLNTGSMKSFSDNIIICPICNNQFNKEGNSNYPFCSDFCKQSWIELQDIEEGEG